MVSFNSEFNGGGSSETNGVESIEDIPEMSDLKQDVETYKQASCATQGGWIIFKESLYETKYIPKYFSIYELYIPVCVYLVGFVMCEAASSTHNFASKVYSPHDPKSFLKAVRKEVHCRFWILF